MAEKTHTERVLIPLPGIGTLALDAEVYRAALAEGGRQEAVPHGSGENGAEPLLDAEQLAAALSIPASWLEQAALTGKIPSLTFGRWRRFRRSEVEAAVRKRGSG